LLRDAQENYPEWLEAIAGAQQHIHFESYIIHEDDTGREFADALIAKAREGARRGACPAYLRLDGRLG
jgi:cardiolipin synthase